MEATKLRQPAPAVVWPVAAPHARVGSCDAWFLRPSEAEGDIGLCEAWQSLVTSSENLNVLYQSPVWWDEGLSKNDEQYRVAVLRADDGRLVGAVPVKRQVFPLECSVRGRVLCKLHVPVVKIFGGAPLMPPDVGAHLDLFSELLALWPDVQAVYMDSVFSGSSCWNAVLENDEARRRFLVYLPDGVRPQHLIQVPNTLDDYLAGLGSKARRNLRRDKPLRAAGNGRLELERIEREDQVEKFLRDARPVFEDAWQSQHKASELDQGADWLCRLARRGLLRAYSLRCGDACCTYVLNFQFQDVLYAIETAFNPALGKYSPGCALLYHMLGDLYAERTPAWIQPGPGDQQCKRLYSNHTAQDACVMLWRKNLANRARIGIHGMYRAVLERLRRLSAEE